MSVIATPRFTTARGGDSPALCHAVRLGFATARDAELAARRLETANVAVPLRVWREDVPAPAAARLARRRGAAEATRAIEAGLPPARAVLLRYQDQRADLVVVSRRSFLPGPELRRLGGLLLGFGTNQAIDALLTGAAARQADAVAAPGTARPPTVPAWGLGDRLAGDLAQSLRLPADSTAPHGETATWLAALAAVLARCDPDTPVAVGLATSTVHTLTMSGSDLAQITLTDLTAAIRDGLAGAPDAGPEPAWPAVGLVFAPSGARGLEYVPCPGPVFPLTICVVAEADGVSLRCLYRAKYFAGQVVRQFTRQLLTMHQQVRQATDLTAASAEVLDAASLAHIATLGRGPEPPRTHPACLHERVAEQARAHPAALAVCDGEQRLSYADLNARASQLAHGLRELGVRDGDRVGVCLERSANLVTTLLGVLKAGAVYVPMDPAYPAERLRYTVADAGLRVVVGHSDEFPATEGIRVLTPQDLADLAAECPQRPPRSTVTPADPAYVIYTSGSTGRPKGVLVRHANVTALIDATRDEYRLDHTDNWTLFHSSAFDFSVWEIWGCLLTGGQLIVVPHWVSRSPDEFAALLAKEEVTVLSQTPSAFAQLLQADQADPRDLRVRLIVFGGEPLDTRMLLPWFDRHPESGCRVVNMFGITETTVHVTAQTITRQHAIDGSRSVGRALPGWHLYVMDQAQRQVAPGVAGEICVGGAGVALGYLNRPGLTSERFVADPVTGKRMYRSGDQGRLLPDGTLEHLGRLDSQVKVRGFRIELDEIRNVLLELPGVMAAAVVVNRPGRTDAASARIDAYVVLSHGAAATAELRRQVARILPDYMVPTSITVLPALPLTTNGKLDSARLPAPRAQSAPEAGPTPDATADPGNGHFASDLQGVWRTVLSGQAGLDDDFFELGGNSLYAVRVAAGMRDLGWPRIPIRVIYQNPTIRRLAAFLGHPVA